MFIVDSHGSSPFYCGTARFASLSSQESIESDNISECSTSSNGLTRCGKLRRSSKSLSKELSIDCGAEARQIELVFTSWSSSICSIRVSVPSGEESLPLRLSHNQSIRFSPSLPGCGHGNWTITVDDEDGSVKSRSINLSLEGVGTLFFTVDNHFHPRLVSQQFLNLPHTALCTSQRQF
ncbi:hypothetical protein PRIPAC_73014 [Pristionchus pacificus]|uniref:Uncharacterized protein n=1 Tax=Pristionchus pacificus TaxID=54126 RepID=A0A8R1Z6D3_PRIPA|nr:hypothetical protein PRIPAC_73014 [Pristionchus pacificus]